MLQLIPGKLEDNRIIQPNNLCIAICLDAFCSNALSYLDSQNCTILIQRSSKNRKLSNIRDDLYTGVDRSDVQQLGKFQTLTLSKWTRDDPREGNLTKSQR